jgi:hypothetical protein
MSENLTQRYAKDQERPGYKPVGRAPNVRTLGQVLLVFLLVACGAPVTPPASLGLPPIRVLVSVSPEHEADVVAGVDGWALSTRGVREWELTREWEAANVVLLETPALVGMCPHPAMLACTFGVGGLWTHEAIGDPMRVFLVAGQYGPDARTITMHELGHKLGLGHIEGTLMNRSASLHYALPCPDRVPIVELGTRLGVQGLRWCE